MIMASGTIVSRILGFVRAVMLALTIGVTTNAADAFGVANQLPNNVYAIIVGGVLNAVLVPQIVRARSHKDGGQGYIDRLLTLIITMFFAVTVLATAFAPLLVSLYTAGWSSDQLALATAFAYWCLPQLFFYGLYSLLGEVLNARSAFGPFMWAPVLNNLVAIAGLGAFIAIFGADPTGFRVVSMWGPGDIALLAGSATLGVAAQALILFAFWKRIGLKFKLNFEWRGVGLRPAMKAATWTLGMVLVTQIGGLVQTIIASKAASARETNADPSIAIASVAASSIAWLIFMLPHSIATVSIATASFTKISTHAAAKKFKELKADLGSSLRAILAISAIATAALMVLAYPIARVFVGEYPSTIALGNVLVAMMFGLIPFSVVFMLQRAFYALEDTKTPFVFTVVQIALFIAGAVTVSFTVPAQWLVAAMALVNSLSITVQAIIAYRVLGNRIGAFESLKLPSTLLSMILAAALAGGVGILTLNLLGGWVGAGFALKTVLGAIVSSGVVGLVMVAVYAAVLKFLNVPEADTALKALKGIIRR
jgi:putative peptidoglycan lipid II flippase